MNKSLRHKFLKKSIQQCLLCLDHVCVLSTLPCMPRLRSQISHSSIIMILDAFEELFFITFNKFENNSRDNDSSELV